MSDKSTSELGNILKSMKPNEIGVYLKENKSELKDDKRAFYDYFKETLARKRIMLKDVYSFAGVSDSWGGQIIRMESHSNERDTIIRLCLAGHFDLKEFDRALRLYGMNPLDPRSSRDSCLIVAINNRIFRLDQVDDLLSSQGFEILSKEIE